MQYNVTVHNDTMLDGCTFSVSGYAYFVILNADETKTVVATATADGPNTVMAQTLQYRTYAFTDACRMLSAQGFEYAPQQGREHRFLAFTKH